MKLVAAFIVFILCTLIGYMKSYRISAQQAAVAGLLSDTRQLGMQLEFTALPARVLMKKIRSDTPELWNGIAERLENGKSIPEAWQDTLASESCAELAECLDPETRKLMDDFFALFGVSDKATQRKSLEVLYDRLQSHADETSAKQKSKARAINSIGMLCGIAFAIVLI